jgi:hypothetical protein
MKYIRLILLLFIYLNITTIYSQRKIKPNITAVEFKETKIILNKKHAFNYYKKANDFTISDLNDNPLITGKITPLGNSQFASKIYFITVEKEFYNEKIIGRNDLIMTLCDNNVITKQLEIDNEQLDLFIENFNEIELFPTDED